MQLLLLLASLVALCSAVTINDIQLGEYVNGVLLPQPTDEDAYNQNLYKVWVPEDAAAVSINFQPYQLPDDCDYIRFYLRTGGAPCAYNSPSGTICNNDIYDWGSGQSTGGNFTLDLDQDSSRGYFRWVVGEWWYFGISKYSALDRTATCGYQFHVAVTSSCPTGSYAAYLYADSTVTCIPYVTASALPFSQNQEIAPWNSYVAGGIRFVPPVNVGQVIVNFVTNATSLDAYGSASAGATYSSSATKNTCGSIQSQADGFYMICDLPKSGNYFYVGWNTGSSSSSEGIYLNITINETVCAPGTGGRYCAYPAAQFNASAITPFFLNATSDDQYYEYYVDIEPNNTGSITFLNFTVSVQSGGSGYIYWRRNAWVYELSTFGYDNSYYYTGLSSGSEDFLVLLEEDLYPGGRYYLVVQCSSGICNGTVANGGGSSTSTTAAPTTVSLTTASATGTTASATGTTASATGTTASATGTTASATGTTASATGTTASATGTTASGTTASSTTAHVTGNTTETTTGEDLSTTTDAGSALTSSVVVLLATLAVIVLSL